MDKDNNGDPALILPGTLASIRPLGEFVLQAAADCGLDHKPSYQLRLAVEEIATNAVIHGYHKQQKRGNFRVCARPTDERLVIVVEESSPEYDPRQTPPPQDLERPLTERPQGGLGVYLALMGVHEYDYQRIQDTNRHIFVQLNSPD